MSVLGRLLLRSSSARLCPSAFVCISGDESQARTTGSFSVRRGPHSQLLKKQMSTCTTSSSNSDVIIIGAGIIGMSTALALTRRGWSVTVVDTLPAVGQGSTSYSSGIVRWFYTIPESVMFSWEAYHYWKEWDDFIGVKDERGMANLRQCGAILMRTKESEPFLKASCEILDNLGLTYEDWSKEELEARMGENTPYKWCLDSYGPPKSASDEMFGELNTQEPIAGAVYSAETGYVADPNLAVVNLETAAKETGRYSFRCGQKVIEILKDKGRATGVKLKSGEVLSAPVIVNAAGPHSREVTDMAFSENFKDLNDMTLTTTPLRQEVAYLPGLEGCESADEMPITLDMDAGCYFRSDLQTSILIGSIELECDRPLEFIPKETNLDDVNVCLSELHGDYSYRAALRLPGLQLSGSSTAKGIVSFYDVTEDWTPIYDKSSLPGYYMAIGTSGNQFKNAGPVGMIMADIIEATENGTDTDENPIIFNLDKSGIGALNTSVFSRRRKLLDTSGTVLG
eukprot:m.338066 g.338066  ORF g.338066 m.338066 type:complete len:512 (-) comp18306_c0_seq1:141-1676(-)